MFNYIIIKDSYEDLESHSLIPSYTSEELCELRMWVIGTREEIGESLSPISIRYIQRATEEEREYIDYLLDRSRVLGALGYIVAVLNNSFENEAFGESEINPKHFYYNLLYHRDNHNLRSTGYNWDIIYGILYADINVIREELPLQINDPIYGVFVRLRLRKGV